VLVAHFLVLPAYLGDFAQIEREPQRIQRRPPQLASDMAWPSTASASASSPVLPAR
jgi:hypothetical protein